MKFLLNVIALMAFLLPAQLNGDNYEDYFAQGVEEYYNGNYENALEQFKSIEDSGFVNWELYYNLGNCYYQLGQKGMAVAYFHKARILAPRNEDIKGNLTFVKRTLLDKPDDSLKNQIWEFARNSSLYFRADELTWFIFILYVGLVFVLIYMIFFKRFRTAVFITGFSLIFLIVISGLMLGINLKLNYHTPRGVIVEREVNILSGPGATSNVRATAHEGLTFTILRQESGFYEGIFANKLKGWVDISRAYKF